MSEPTLTLTIVGTQPPPGVRTSHVFHAAGGSIGRADDCDWMLAAPGISRVHAVVRYVHGLYFLEDRSTNGMLRNGAPLSRGEPVTLGDGDRLQMDSFELAARIADTAAHAPGPLPDDPADGDRTIVVPAAAASAQAPSPAASAAPAHLGRNDDDWDFGLGPVAAAAPHAPAAPVAASMPASGDGGLDALLAGFGGAAPPPGLDPLQLFDPPPAPAPDAGDHWNHAPASTGHYQPPRAVAAPATLPEAWDLTRGDFGAAPAAPAPHPTVQAPGPDDVESILRIVVDGVMETLRARAEIKNTFRLPVTIIQRSENNPLKFAATPEEAMRRLFERDSAFLGGAAAFDDAFDDIRCHQMAMLAGMRAAFESLLAHFSPERLEREVDAGGRRAFAGRGRYWERYRDDFARAAKDPDTAFRMLFGDEFARAYEAQLARLKSARRRAPGR